MKKELDYFYIGRSFGGNQDWFTDYWMRIGGCAAAAACDSCIAIEKAGIKRYLYPFNINHLTKEEYLKFAMKMKPYLQPRRTGIDRLEIYIDGMKKYLQDTGLANLRIQGFSGDRTVQEAIKYVKWQINHRFPIPFLLLSHKDSQFKNVFWHWFMLVGYEEVKGEFYVKMVTYGEARYLPFKELWDTGYEKKGGMILYS